MRDRRLQLPQLIITVFLLVLVAAAWLLKMDMAVLFNESLVKLVMNGVLVLSLIPMLNVGAGLNFGLPVGIIGGLLGMLVAVNFRLTGFYGFFAAILFSLVFCLVLGWVYGLILNRVKDREEIAGTFIGFSFIPLMNYFWTLAPFTNREMLYPIGGQGLRPKISLEKYFNHIVDNLWVIRLGDIEIPFGLLLFFALVCLFLFWYFKTKIGRAIIAVGENEAFAKLSGIDIARTRLTAIIISTVIAGASICIYTQSYGFIQLYDAPLSMAFPAISAILIGGSSGKRTFVFQAVLGTYLLQSLYLLTVPIANELLIPELTEILRTFVTYGIILYALLVREKERRSVL